MSRKIIQPPTPNNVHVRKCWDCDSVAEHADDVVPYVLCIKCGSQDTRRVHAVDDGRVSVPAQIVIALAGIPVDDYDARCNAVRDVLNKFGIKTLQRYK